MDICIPAENEEMATVINSKHQYNNHISEIIVHRGLDDYNITDQLKLTPVSNGNIDIERTVSTTDGPKPCIGRLNGLAITIKMTSEVEPDWEFSIYTHKGFTYMTEKPIEKPIKQDPV